MCTVGGEGRGGGREGSRVPPACHLRIQVAAITPAFPPSQFGACLASVKSVVIVSSLQCGWLPRVPLCCPFSFLLLHPFPPSCSPPIHAHSPAYVQCMQLRRVPLCFPSSFLLLYVALPASCCSWLIHTHQLLSPSSRCSFGLPVPLPKAPDGGL